MSVLGRAAVAAGLLFTLGCGPGATRISLTNADHGRIIAVMVGDELDITLQTIGPGAYETPSVSSGAIRFLGASLTGPPNPGGPRQTFRFEAVAIGRAEIRIEHADGFPVPRDPFVVSVDVH